MSLCEDISSGCSELTTRCFRLGIELTKIMVLQYSNQETSVTIGESVRDEDGALDALGPSLHPD